MCVPRYYSESDRDTFIKFIDKYAFGTLVSMATGRPVVTQLPFLTINDEVLKLQGHLARANPHWQELDSGEPIQVFFQGPHAYISPSWYAGEDVPTWDYATVHVEGIPKLLTAGKELAHHVEQLAQKYEYRNGSNWDQNYSPSELRHIVGFEIDVTTIAGIFKLSQNRSIEDQRSVIAGLKATDNMDSIAMALFIEDSLRRHPARR